mmetsp:Transcript_8596/g.25857  ORF Transcript_8596/g.25857 Transcript_8596/m.25857 type:complete len:217 (-) Transcript_8596:34-684(-)
MAGGTAEPRPLAARAAGARGGHPQGVAPLARAHPPPVPVRGRPGGADGQDGHRQEAAQELVHERAAAHLEAAPRGRGRRARRGPARARGAVRRPGDALRDGPAGRGPAPAGWGRPAQEAAPRRRAPRGRVGRLRPRRARGRRRGLRLLLPRARRRRAAAVPPLLPRRVPPAVARGRGHGARLPAVRRRHLQLRRRVLRRGAVIMSSHELAYHSLDF